VEAISFAKHGKSRPRLRHRREISQIK
jgi:hypothetical protein